MIHLLGMTLTQLKSVVADLGMPAFTDKQIADWLYNKKISTIDEMTNISLKNRQLLSEKYDVGISAPVDVKESVDGTKKYLFAVGEHRFVETVYIPDKDRATLCVSSQVGCKMNCLFCNTGKQGFASNLSATDILNQIQAIEETEKLTNVVFMGMGEPMDNVEVLLQVLEVMTSNYGYAWSPKRITVSSVGLIPGLKRFLEESNCHLAISLHSPFPDERLKLMPVQKAFPAEKVIDLISQYDFYGQRKISFEYIVFKGLNDSVKHADELKKLVGKLPCLINLIRFHEIPDVPLKGATDAEMHEFESLLLKRGINTTIRHSRGQDIWAACGLLSTLKQNGQI